MGPYTSIELYVADTIAYYTKHLVINIFAFMVILYIIQGMPIIMLDNLGLST